MVDTETPPFAWLSPNGLDIWLFPRANLASWAAHPRRERKFHRRSVAAPRPKRRALSLLKPDHSGAPPSLCATPCSRLLDGLRTVAAHDPLPWSAALRIGSTSVAEAS